MLGCTLNPYPLHYTGAFAFSDFLYPLDDSALITLRLLLRFDLKGESVGLTVFRF